MTWSEAREAGAMFYTGKVCPKHPEEGGRRRTLNGNCHKCIGERMKKKREKRREQLGLPPPRKYRKAGEQVT